MPSSVPYHALPGRSLADYTGPWPVPRYWGLRPEEVATFRRYGIYSRLAYLALALLALPTFWLPDDVLTHHPWLRAFVLDGFGRLFPLVRVANTVGPHGQVMAVMWMVVLIGSWGLIAPVAARYAQYTFAHCDYSLVRWYLLPAGRWRRRTSSGKGSRQSVLAWVFCLVSLGIVMLGCDFYGYLALLQGTSLTTAAYVQAGVGGMLTGWGYVHGIFGSSFNPMTRAGLYRQELLYGGLGYGMGTVAATVSVLFAHWDTLWPTTRIDEQALDALWATRKRFRFGRRAS